MSISGNSSIGNSIPKLKAQTSGVAPTGQEVIENLANKTAGITSKRTEAEAAAEKADTFLNRTFRKGHIKDLENKANSLKQAEDQMNKAMDQIRDLLEKFYSTMYS